MFQLSQESGAGTSFDVSDRCSASDGATQHSVNISLHFMWGEVLMWFFRPSALTLVADPRMTFAMDFDNLVSVCKLLCS
jgi:hypothetical protein